jgi:hypothetical protein
MTGFDLKALVAVLNEEGVDFVVVGGVAVGAHGYVRATRDLDLVPAPEPANLLSLARALNAVHATLPLAGGRAFELPRDLPRLERGENMTLDTDYGGVDVLQRAPGVPTFTTLNSAAIESNILGLPVKISSLDHLRQMKSAAGRAQDRADLENLPPAAD